ncbi:MAG: tol-pal system protein YbgF [Sideroxydans sp.]|nr:tol-pal system protein YbgF [Sideroxydans sp.]
MFKLRWLLLGVYLVSSPAWAGLFADDDARKQVQVLEARVLKLEEALARAEEDSKIRIRALLELQTQLEAQAAELRKLNGQNEELAHSLQDAEKRQKDYYVDLDARVRRFESADGSALPLQGAKNAADGAANPVGENKTFEAAYGLYKAENYQNAATAFRDFLKQFPQSVHEANVNYWMGNAYFLSKDYANSLDSYQALVSKFQDHPRVPEALLNIAECQLELKNKFAAQKTLKQVITQFPGSDASDKAKKRLATLK